MAQEIARAESEGRLADAAPAKVQVRNALPPPFVLSVAKDKSMARAAAARTGRFRWTDGDVREAEVADYH